MERIKNSQNKSALPQSKINFLPKKISIAVTHCLYNFENPGSGIWAVGYLRSSLQRYLGGENGVIMKKLPIFQLVLTQFYNKILIFTMHSVHPEY